MFSRWGIPATDGVQHHVAWRKATRLQLPVADGVGVDDAFVNQAEYLRRHRQGLAEERLLSSFAEFGIAGDGVVACPVDGLPDWQREGYRVVPRHNRTAPVAFTKDAADFQHVANPVPRRRGEHGSGRHGGLVGRYLAWGGVQSRNFSVEQLAGVWPEFLADASTAFLAAFLRERVSDC